MNPVNHDPLAEALALMGAGRGDDACQVLARFVSQHPEHERAWHMLSYALTEREQQVYALQRVLAINPSNRAARRRIEQLQRPGLSAQPISLPPARSVPSGSAPSATVAPPRPTAKDDQRVGDSLWSRRAQLSYMLHRVVAQPSLALGLTIVLLFVLTAILAPIIAPPQGDDPFIIPRDGYSPIPQPPGPGHPLGTMEKQSDVLYGLIWGARAALRVGLLIMIGRAAIGILVGLVSGFLGGWVDSVLMRITDAFMSLPIIAAVMVTVALFGFTLQSSRPGRYYFMPVNEEPVVIVTLVVFGWMGYARLLRGNVISELQRDYVEAAVATGTRRFRILFRHILPNSTQGLAVLLTSDIGAAVILLAAFNYIGLIGIWRTMMAADWGRMLSLSRNWIIGSPSSAFEYWYTYIPASTAIVLFSMGWSLVGDGLRDAMDPRLRGRTSPRRWLRRG